jgi:uncharacterized iron-regulated protein
MIRLKRILMALMVLSTVLLAFADEEEKILRLKLGQEDLKEKVMEVSADTIYSAEKGTPIPFAEMIQEMAASRFIYVGETHNSLPMHQIQAEIIRVLYEQDRNLSVGLEMFPLTQQEALNKWSLGILSECEFIRTGQWYVTWNFNFGFYRSIFQLAKEKSLPVFALNAPRDIISQIRMRGWEALSEEEKEMIPKPGLGHEEHKSLIRTIFESTDLPPQMKGKGLEMAFEGLYRAQSAWDETMAFYALKALAKEEGKMVVLAGSGHLLYNLGINRRAFEKSQLPFKTVVCVVIPKDKQSIEVSRTLADYVWGIHEEEKPAFPSIGLSFKKISGLDNLVIDKKPKDGVAEDGNFEKGDVILSVDGKTFRDINELRIYLARFTWGDEVEFLLLRDAEEIQVVLKFLAVENGKEKQL